MLPRATRWLVPLLTVPLSIAAKASVASAQAAPFQPTTARVPESSQQPASPSTAPADNAPPRLLHFVSAEYPAEARTANIEGSVVLSLTVDENGHVSEASVV